MSWWINQAFAQTCHPDCYPCASSCYPVCPSVTCPSVTNEALFFGLLFGVFCYFIASWRWSNKVTEARKKINMAHPRIKRDPKVMMGKPVIASTRITVEHILRCLAAGNSLERILRNYPNLSQEDIRAAQAYAADYLAD